MITIDTSALLAVIGARDSHHQEAIQILDADGGPYVIPVAALSEMAYMIERSFPASVEQAFLSDLRANAYLLDCHDPDLSRIQQLAQKYDDLPLGLADAAIISCAELHGGRVLTFDRRHFGVVAIGERRLTVLPGLA